jgi:PAS domain S-box-containing protein
LLGAGSLQKGLLRASFVGYEQPVGVASGGEEKNPAQPAGPRLGEREHLLLAALERVNRTILAASSLEPMLSGVLDAMLELFECERAWLLYPCDPSASTFSVPMERTRPEWPGAGATRERLPMTPYAQLAIAGVLGKGGVLRCDGVHEAMPELGGMTEQFAIRSQMLMAIRPRSGPAWCLGLHHCVEARVYHDDEAALFEAIGARIGDGLTSFLALQASLADRRRLEQAQQKARLGSYEWTRGDVEAYWSKELYRLLGYEPGGHPAMFSSVVGAIHPDDRERFRCQVGRIMQAGGEYEVQARARRANGEEWVMHAWGQAVVDASGQLQSMMGVAQDVTERVQAEELQRRLEAQLRQSQKMQAVGQLTGGVAHDFNNLLTVILGNLDEIRDQLLGRPLGIELLDQLQQAASQAAELTQRLSAFSRQQPLQPRVVDAARLVANLESLLRRTLGVDISIEVVEGARLWSCEVDPAQLENALLNLAVNARDAMPKGGKLRIETENACVDRLEAEPHDEVRAGEYVLVSVTDNGVGMSEQVLSRAFDPFFTTKGPGRGTGLGLSMVYGFVKQSGGHVRLSSTPGVGTSAKIYLPRSLQAAVPTEPPRPASKDPQGNSEIILVVEDDPHVQALTVRMLERLGYRVHVAEDGPSALRVLEQHAQIDLLFTDIVLPNGMNGVELSKVVRGLRPELPVLYTSGYTENAVIHHGRLDPGVQLLEKPFTRAELAQHIRQALSGMGSVRV